MVSIQPANVVDNLVVQMQGRVLLKHPIIDMDHAAMSDTAATIRASTNGSAITGSTAGDRGGGTEAVTIKRAPLSGADMVREAVELGFPEKKVLREIRRDVEVTGAEKVEEDTEALGVPINEDVGFGLRIEIEIPMIIKECAEKGIAAGISKRSRGCLEDFTANVEGNCVFWDHFFFLFPINCRSGQEWMTTLLFIFFL